MAWLDVSLKKSYMYAWNYTELSLGPDVGCFAKIAFSKSQKDQKEGVGQSEKLATLFLNVRPSFQEATNK